MTNELGKELRKLRIEREERLLDMAERLGKSSSFISAIETGKKPIPARFEEEVINAYDLPQHAAQSLRQASDRSRKEFTVRPDAPRARDTAALFARRINSLSEDQLTKIEKLLAKKGSG